MAGSGAGSDQQGQMSFEGQVPNCTARCETNVNQDQNAIHLSTHG